MTTMRKLEYAWKYRRVLWKYRKLLRRRKEIAVGLLAAGAVAAVIVWRGSATANRQRTA